MTIEKCIETLFTSKSPYEVEALFDFVCKLDRQIDDYIGPNHKMKHNHKIRDIVEVLRNHPSGRIKQTNNHPVVLKWFDSDSGGDPGDPGDVPTQRGYQKSLETEQVNKDFEDINNNPENQENDTPLSTDTSPTSPSNSNNMTREQIEQAIEEAATKSTESVMFLCPICKFAQFKTQKEFHKKSCSGLEK